MGVAWPSAPYRPRASHGRRPNGRECGGSDGGNRRTRKGRMVKPNHRPARSRMSTAVTTNSSRAKISIVTPCLNARHFIEGCVESVRHTLAGHDYEHIVVDGISTDGTLEYLRAQPD